MTSACVIENMSQIAINSSEDYKKNNSIEIKSEIGLSTGSYKSLNISITVGCLAVCLFVCLFVFCLVFCFSRHSSTRRCSIILCKDITST